MTVDLSAIPLVSATPRLVDFGGLLSPSLGGPVQRIDRLGSRWAWSFDTSIMPMEPDGRRWAASLAQAKREGALMQVPQPGLAIGGPGSPAVGSATPSGRTVPVAGATSGYVIRQGQWVSIVHGGHRYLDQVSGDVTVASDGTAAMQIQNLLRVPLSAGDVVEIAEPHIEGWIVESLQWQVALNETTLFSFSIAEAA